jgi:hypothetical protein
VLLAAALSGLSPVEQAPLVEELYRTGEVRERQALLVAGLPARPGALRGGGRGRRAQRPVRAGGDHLRQPLPAAFFAEAAFNQMVLKALLNEIPLRRVFGLRERRGEELARMVDAYASERRAAGREVPADAALVTGGPRA